MALRTEVLPVPIAARAAQLGVYTAIGTFKLDYEYEIEYEYDFRISKQ